MQQRDLVAFDLKSARKKRNLSQSETAEILCTTQPSISRWESEGTLPAICRKAWEQHWKLEEMKNDDMRTQTGRANLRGVSKGIASAEDAGTRSAVGSTAESSSRKKGIARRRREIPDGMETLASKDA